MTELSNAEQNAKGNENNLLEVKSLTKSYPITQSGVFKRIGGYHEVLKGVSFSVKAGETFAIVGESGCGKSTLARLIMCLEKPNSGEVYYQGQAIQQLSHHNLMPYRRQIQMVFQDPGTALNARFSVEQLIKEPLDIHHSGNSVEKSRRIDEVLEQVELSRTFRNRYIHELSGGQRQRVAIARSIVLNPTLLLLDEPLSALDVTIQQQITNLFKKIQQQLNMTMILISHDLGLVEHFSDRTLVLYFGEVAECRNSRDLFKSPDHAYTKLLLSNMPNKIGKTQFNKH